MGLDMYLVRQASIANYDFDDEGKKISAAILKGLKVKNLDQYHNGSIIVELPAGYWRKANHIHAWFVNNVQDGVDECQVADVPEAKLIELRDVCKQVLADHSLAPSLLPRQQGFLFGGDEYDEWYFRDLEDTVEILDRALDPDNKVSKYDSFSYHSSW